MNYQMTLQEYVKSDRFKDRFDNPAKGGQLDREQLWDLSIPVLDQIALALDNQLQKTSKTFVPNAQVDTANSEIQRKLNIVTYIIQTKHYEQQAAKLQTQEQAARTQEQQEILQALELVRRQELLSKSPEELKAMLEKTRQP